jgi:acetylornithine deacetylase/succinyl-diaminopimelate desuccinylase-like protein
MANVESYVNELAENVFPDRLAKLVEEKSVSSVPEFNSEVRSCAEVTRELLRDIGARAYLVETDGQPLVVGEIENKKDAHTVAIYNHYDVQPCNIPNWKTDPWKLELKEGRYYGRGTSDNKGPLLTVINAVQLACQEDVPLNYLFIYEGEEESGTSHFTDGVQKVAKKTKPDSVLVPDITWLDEKSPAIIYGTRGNLYMHFNLKIAESDVHSGLAGGPARNAIAELMDVAAKCHKSENGEILIPHIHDDVVKPSEKEMRYWLQSPFNVKTFAEDLSINKLRFYDRKRVMKSIWASPTLEVHGCVGGYMEKNGQKTIIPGEAQLLVSMRLVPNQDPDKIFSLVKQFVGETNSDVEVRKVSTSRPYLGKIDSPPIEAADKAFQNAFRYSVSRVRCGGSIGAIMHMCDAFGQPPIVATGLSLPTDNIHGPNEHFERRQVVGGTKAFFNYFKAMSELR